MIGMSLGGLFSRANITLWFVVFFTILLWPFDYCDHSTVYVIVSNRGEFADTFHCLSPLLFCEQRFRIGSLIIPVGAVCDVFQVATSLRGRSLFLFRVLKQNKTMWMY